MSNICSFSGVGEIEASTNVMKGIENLRTQLSYRQVWMASSVHDEELEGWCFIFTSFRTTVVSFCLSTSLATIIKEDDEKMI